MANTATNVTTGKPRITGGVYVAPRTATLPTDASTALGNDYVSLGYISEDGVENSNEPDFNEIKEWGGSIVYRSLSGMDDTFSLTLIESLNVDVLKSVYGDSNVTVDSQTGKITVNNVAEDPQEKIWVFDLALRGDKLRRIVVPDGAITARETVTYNATDAIGYGITVTAYPDSNNKTHIEYTEDA